MPHQTAIEIAIRVHALAPNLSGKMSDLFSRWGAVQGAFVSRGEWLENCFEGVGCSASAKRRVFGGFARSDERIFVQCLCAELVTHMRPGQPIPGIDRRPPQPAPLQKQIQSQSSRHSKNQTKKLAPRRPFPTIFLKDVRRNNGRPSRQRPFPASTARDYRLPDQQVPIGVQTQN